MKTNSFLKRAAILAVVAMATVSNVSAQKQGDKAVGGNLAISSGGDITNFGIGAKFQYNVTTPIRLEGSFTYFLPTEVSGVDYSAWDLSLNAHYLFNVADKVSIYPLAGLGVLGMTASSGGASLSDSKVGFNIGAGLNYRLTEELIGSLELKDQFVDAGDRLYISVGVAYKF